MAGCVTDEEGQTDFLGSDRRNILLDNQKESKELDNQVNDGNIIHYT